MQCVSEDFGSVSLLWDLRKVSVFQVCIHSSVMQFCARARHTGAGVFLYVCLTRGDMLTCILMRMCGHASVPILSFYSYLLSVSSVYISSTISAYFELSAVRF